MEISIFEMKYLTDVSGNKTDVVLPFNDYLELIEEIEDLRAIADRKDEETVDHNEVFRLIETDERV